MKNFVRNIRGSSFWKYTLTFLMVLCLGICSVVCYIPGVKAEDAENISSEESILETDEDSSEESESQFSEDSSEEGESETVENSSEEGTSEIVEDSSEESTPETPEDSSEEGTTQSFEDSSEGIESETAEDSSDRSISLYADGSSEAKYDRSYNISDILSQFQFFTSGDAIMSNAHTVGPIVVGGTLDLDPSFGDVSLVPSYVAHLKNGKLGTATTDGVDGTVNRFAYYATSEDGAISEYETRWIHNPRYIDLGAAFSAIKRESQNLASNSTKISATGNVVTIDCTKNADVYVVMDYATFNSAQSINIKVNGVDWFKNHICSISVTGVESKEITYDGYGKICVNGTPINNQLKDMSGGVYNKQANLGGMNLVWNFPDATGEITVTGLGGHLVAPQAPVNLAGGNYEGGIIAASLGGTGAEGHFYPMNKILKTNAGTTGSGGTTGSDGTTGNDSTTGSDGTTGNDGTTENGGTTGSTGTTGSENGNTNGETQKGGLVIVVTDEETGAAVPNATVTVKDALGNENDYVTDENGTITIEELDPGTYDVTVKEVPDGYKVSTGESASVLVEAGKITLHEALILSANDTGTGTGTSNSVTSNSQVQTGDAFDFVIPVGLILVSLLGMVLVVIPGKKH